MKKPDINWKVFAFYMTILLFILWCGTAFGQVKVVQYNAGWNKSNNVKWFNELSDCKKSYIDIAKDTKAQSKHKVVVVPTIIIFKDGEEVARFQADISFSMKATRKEVQEIINEQLMSDF